MPRKSIVSELQANETTTNSPLRRSSRINSQETSTPRGIATRRNSQTDNQTNSVPKPTRNRRSSVQDVDEKTETKPATRTRRASTLAEEEVKKEAASTPSRRGRKPLVSEPKEEKAKTVHTRRSSAANIPVEAEQKPQATRGRSKSVDVPETQPTPKQSARRKKTSESDDASETAKPVRGRRSVVVSEPTEKKPATRRGRRASVEPEYVEKQSENKTEEETTDGGISPVVRDMSVNITPLKKTRILDKTDGDLDLSIINESDDMENSPGITENSQRIITAESNRKRLSISPSDCSAPRKSPRLVEKLFKENTPEQAKTVSPRKSLTKQLEQINGNQKNYLEADILDTHSSDDSISSNKENVKQSRVYIDFDKESDANNKSATEDTDGDDNNFIIEETVNTVDFSIKPKSATTKLNIDYSEQTEISENISSKPLTSKPLKKSLSPSKSELVKENNTQLSENKNVSAIKETDNGDEIIRNPVPSKRKSLPKENQEKKQNDSSVILNISVEENVIGSTSLGDARKSLTKSNTSELENSKTVNDSPKSIHSINVNESTRSPLLIPIEAAAENKCRSNSSNQENPAGVTMASPPKKQKLSLSADTDHKNTDIDKKTNEVRSKPAEITEFLSNTLVNNNNLDKQLYKRCSTNENPMQLVINVEKLSSSSQPEDIQAKTKLSNILTDEKSLQDSPKKSSAQKELNKGISLKSSSSSLNESVDKMIPVRGSHGSSNPQQDTDSTYYDFNLPSEDEDVFVPDDVNVNKHWDVVSEDKTNPKRDASIGNQSSDCQEDTNYDDDACSNEKNSSDSKITDISIADTEKSNNLEPSQNVSAIKENDNPTEEAVEKFKNSSKPEVESEIPEDSSALISPKKHQLPVPNKVQDTEIPCSSSKNSFISNESLSLQSICKNALTKNENSSNEESINNASKDKEQKLGDVSPKLNDTNESTVGLNASLDENEFNQSTVEIEPKEKKDGNSVNEKSDEISVNNEQNIQTNMNTLETSDTESKISDQENSMNNKSTNCEEPIESNEVRECNSILENNQKDITANEDEVTSNENDTHQETEVVLPTLADVDTECNKSAENSPRNEEKEISEETVEINSDNNDDIEETEFPQEIEEKNEKSNNLPEEISSNERGEVDSDEDKKSLVDYNSDESDDIEFKQPSEGTKENNKEHLEKTLPDVKKIYSDEDNDSEEELILDSEAEKEHSKTPDKEISSNEDANLDENEGNSSIKHNSDDSDNLKVKKPLQDREQQEKIQSHSDEELDSDENEDNSSIKHSFDLDEKRDVKVKKSLQNLVEENKKPQDLSEEKLSSDEEADSDENEDCVSIENILDSDDESCDVEVKKSPKNERNSKNLSNVNAELDDYIKYKVSQVDDSDSDVEEEEIIKCNDFIDDMAEEGEEDTPSEDSNQIIDEGESIGFSDPEEQETEDEYENDSFICDEEDYELLSGEEYDLGGEKKPKKKSRIINNDDLPDDEIINIQKKNTEKPKKKSRIFIHSISSTDDELEDFRSEVLKEDKMNESAESTKEIAEPVEIKDSVGPKEIQQSENIECNATTNEPVLSKSENDKKNETLETVNEPITETSLMKTDSRRGRRKTSLNIQENIMINGSSDPSITKRISSLLDSFCSSVSKGEVTLNISVEYEEDKSKSPPQTSAAITENLEAVCDISSDDSNALLDDSHDTEDGPQLNVSMDAVHEITDLRDVLNSKATKRRLSRSADDVRRIIEPSKKQKTVNRPVPKNKSKQELGKKQKKKHLKTFKEPTTSSFNLISQLITDIKNRPRRTIKPSQYEVDASTSPWVTSEVGNLKPSTSPVSKTEQIQIKPKTHPKDFKNQMLSNPSRVKRINTNTLLKKKGVFD